MKYRKKVILIEDGDDDNISNCKQAMRDLGFEVLHLRFLPFRSESVNGDKLDVYIDYAQLATLIGACDMVIMDGLLKTFIDRPSVWGLVGFKSAGISPPDGYPNLHKDYCRKLQNHEVSFRLKFFGSSDGPINTSMELIPSVRSFFSGPMVAWSSLEGIRQEQCKSGCDYSISGDGKSPEQLIGVLNDVMEDRGW